MVLGPFVPHSFPRNLLYILGKTGMSSIDLDQMQHFVCHSSSNFTHIHRQLNGFVEQGPVVQSIVSLTSSLRVISLTVLADSVHSILIFFAEKM